MAAFSFGLAAVCLLVAAQLILPAIATNEATTTTRWQRLQWSCLNHSSWLLRTWKRSRITCLSEAAQVNAVVVAEWTSSTGVCSVYDYKSVYHLANVAGGGSGVCAVYRHVATAISFTKFLSQKLAAAWLFGADANTKSLVRTSSDAKNRFYPVSINWNSDGAVLNGGDAFMLLNDSEHLNFDTGFTWLLRLKRQPKLAAIMESMSCDDFYQSAGHLWEYGQTNEFNYNTYNRMALPSSITNPARSMVNDANTWMNIGISVGSGNAINLFLDGSFLPDSAVSRGVNVPGTPLARYCVLLGTRWDLGMRLQGTVRAVGIANATMTEAEMQEFFWTIPRS